MLYNRYKSVYVESENFVLIDFNSPQDFKKFLNLMQKYGYDKSWEYDKSSSFNNGDQYVKIPKLVYNKMSRMFNKFGVNYYEV